MCGIWGIVAGPGATAPQRFDAYSEVVRHRGPDDEGVVVFPSQVAAAQAFGGPDTPAACFSAGLPYSPKGLSYQGEYLLALGHRRLSIVDVSASGHQPMCSADGKLWIVYNGEVYNHVELRQELEALGHQFASRSDTEVILAAYRAWGSACLHRFNGMFGLLLYDTERRTLFVARDRFGVKPLYYWISPAGFLAFASEIKQFARLEGWQARLHGQRAYDFLAWGLLDHTEQTMFSGVHQLCPGEALTLELADGFRGLGLAPGSRLSPRRWYELKPAQFDGDFDAAAGRLGDLLEDAVRLRLRADVPVGSCLSGGLDSSSIVCVMNRLLGRAGAQGVQRTFSACSEIPRYDERAFIDEVVASTGVEPHYVYPALESLFPSLDRLTWHQDEPFGSTSIYAQSQVFALAARNGVKVMLDGQGADEQLAGYHSYFGPRLGSLLVRGRLAEVWREMQALRTLHGYGALWVAKAASNNLLPEALRQPLRLLAGRTSARPAWLDLDVLGAQPRDPHLRLGAAKADSIRALSHAQLTGASLQMLLHWEDRSSMAHAVEARVPFLDYRLVEFLLGLPDDYKLAGGVTKRVLRQAMRGLLPEKIRGRMDKLGFVTAEEVWLRQRASGEFRGALTQAIELARGAIKPQALRMLEETIAGTRPFSFALWRLISFGSWLRTFEVRM